VRGRKGAYRKELEKLAQDGYVRVRINGELFPLDDPPQLDKRKNHTIEVVVDRLLVKQGIASRLEQSIATALKLASGLVTVAVVSGKECVGKDQRPMRLRAEADAFQSASSLPCRRINGLSSNHDFASRRQARKRN